MMQFKDIGEFGFIERIRQTSVKRPARVIRGIGDDAAAFIPYPGEATLVTIDLLAEGIHFERDMTSGFKLGYKALAVNLSDIAAMGGIAREVFVGISIPNHLEFEFVDEIFNGIKTLAGRYNINILGGDTSAARSDLVVNVVVIGGVDEKEMLCRDSARPGDIIFATGFLGDSRAGLDLLKKGESVKNRAFQPLVRAHLTPEPHLAEGRFLSSCRRVNACIDVSDGLCGDVGHIAEQSKAGITLFADRIPISENLRAFCRALDLDPLEFALRGGEDYVLLCTVPLEQAQTVASEFERDFGRSLFRIGEVTASNNMQIIAANGEARSFPPNGWKHF